MNIQMNKLHGIGIRDRKYFQWKHYMVIGANC
jgi:hypothetical protein